MAYDTVQIKIAHAVGQCKLLLPIACQVLLWQLQKYRIIRLPGAQSNYVCWEI